MDSDSSGEGNLLRRALYCNSMHFISRLGGIGRERRTGYKPGTDRGIDQ